MKIFLSYRRRDSEDQTGRIFDYLISRFGKENIFLDVEGIHGGEKWRVKLEEKIAECDAFLVVIGDRWLEELRSREGGTDMVRREVRMAIDTGTPIIPVLVGRASSPTETDLPEDIRQVSEYQVVKVRSGSDFRRDAEALEKALEQFKPPSNSPPEPPTEENPRKPERRSQGPMMAVLAAFAALVAAVSFWYFSSRVPPEPEPVPPPPENKTILSVKVGPVQKIGERVELELVAEADTWVRAIHHSSDGYDSALFPGPTGEDGFLRAGSSKVVSWEPTPPAGIETVTIYASSLPFPADAAVIAKTETGAANRGIPARIESESSLPIGSEVADTKVSYQLRE